MNVDVKIWYMWCHLFSKFASYKVPPVMVSTHGSVVPLAMFKNNFLAEQMSGIVLFSGLDDFINSPV